MLKQRYLPPGTIRYYLSIPQVVGRDLSGLRLLDVTARIKKYVGGNSAESPDVEAVTFYCLNHLASIVRATFGMDDPLPEWARKVMSAYVETLVAQSQRMFSYMLLIVAREARHVHSKTLTTPWAKGMGPQFLEYLKEIKDSSSETAIAHICNNAPDMSFGKFVDGLVTIFEKGTWSSGYGGAAWAKVAKCLADMVHGDTSLELMVDSAYSLAHNNGPIFNKGMLYSNYTNEFIKILDVQRSGQIPELVQDGGGLSYVKIPDVLKVLVASVKANVSSIGSFVDWVKVEALGALGSYSQEKKNMPKADVPLFFDGKKAMQIGMFQIMPGIAVAQIQRVNS